MIQQMRGLFVVGTALLLALHPLSTAVLADSSSPQVHVVSFGLWGMNALFKREAAAAAEVIASHYGKTGQIIVRANTPKHTSARIGNVRSTIEGLASTIDTENDIVFAFFTSHGSKNGLAVLASDSRRVFDLSPSELIGMLTANRIRNRVIIVSACYSGVFSDLIADPHTLVITAADADHTSFGCNDDNKGNYTYFGEAFFGESFKPGVDIAEAFKRARSSVSVREAAERLPNSNPQMQGGAKVLDALSKLAQPR